MNLYGLEHPLPAENIDQYLGQRIKCKYPFIANDNSKDSDGNLIVSQDLIADIQDGAFDASDFILLYGTR